MHTHLNSLHKAIREHSEALADYNQRTSAMQLMLGKAIDGLRDKVATHTVLRGHLGNIQRCANAVTRAHKAMHEATSAVHDQMQKSVDAMATQAGVSLVGTNPNDFAARQGSTSHGPASDTNSSGELSHGFKAAGVTADEATRLSKSVPVSGNAVLISQVKAAVGLVNKNASSPPFGKNWQAMPEQSQQNRVLSEFEKRAKR
jgi:hypothetical protein